MRKRMACSILGFAILGAGTAFPARAAEDGAGGPDRQVIREEIEAYLKAEKEKKAKEDAEKGVMKASWKDAPVFETADKKFLAKLTGRLQVDFWTFRADEDLEAGIGDEWDTSLFIRRARLGVEMTYLKNTKAKLEVDFARGGSDWSFADMYVAFVDLDQCGAPVPDVYVGHFREPFTLEELTSNKNITFIERSLPVATFAPQRNVGIKVEDSYLPGKRLFLQLGAFANASNNWGDAEFDDSGTSGFSGDADGWAVTGRAVFVPWYDCRCPDCRVVHLGVAGSWRTDLQGDDLRFRARPEVGTGPRIVDTGAVIEAEELLLLGAEAAFVYDRWSVQGEYILADVSAAAQGDPVYSGWYVQGSVWLTGECRNYERGKGIFGNVKPCRPLWCADCCAKGAGGWELAARFSTLDLDDGTPDVRGGTVWDATFGVNWHWNNNVRVMFNYVHSEVTDAYGTAGLDGSVDAFGVRFQAAW